jgi:hypothetical protein
MCKVDGAIGGTADRVGGPFAKDGVVGLVFSFHISLQFYLLSVCRSDGKRKSWGRSSQVADEGSDWAKAAEFWVERLLEEFRNVV